MEIKGQKFHYHENLRFNGFPTTVSLELTNKCNLRCCHCQHTYRNMVQGEAGLELFEAVKPELGGRIKSLQLSGLGESLLSRHWQDFLNACYQVPDLEIGFITNGTRLERLDEGIYNHPVTIALSIDGAKASTYKRIRQSDDFERVVSAVSAITARKKALKSRFPHLTAIYTTTATNMAERADFVRLCHKIGIESVSLCLFVAHFKSQFLKDSPFFFQDEHDRTLRDAIEAGSSLGVEVVHPGTFDGKTPMPEKHRRGWLYRDERALIRCGFTASSCMINYTGHVQVCCAPKNLIAGDIRVNTLEEIWNGSFYRRLKTGLACGFESTCGDICNFIQSVDMQDPRAHYCPLPESGESDESYNYDPGVYYPQPYSLRSLEESYARALTMLGRGGREKAVIDLCLEMEKTEPLLFEAKNLKGIAYSSLGNKQKSLSAFHQAHEIMPDDVPSRKNLDTLARQGIGDFSIEEGLKRHSDHA